MDTATIIHAIEAELETLVRVKNILAGLETYFPVPHTASKPHRKKRVLSPKARKAISDAQKRRWAALKKAA
jgi:hypothetical protein